MQASFNIFKNHRLKKVSFHGEDTFPLYITITRNGKSTTIKSSFFNLLSKERFSFGSFGNSFTPSINTVVEAEKSLMKFLLKKYDEFDLSQAAEARDWWGKDINEIFIEDFKINLQTFFNDEGLSELGKVFIEGVSSSPFYKLKEDLEKSLNPDLFIKLCTNSMVCNSPFFTLNDFMYKNLKSIYLSRYMFEEMADKYENFLRKEYPQCDSKKIIYLINKKLKEKNESYRKMGI